ncbi:MAG: hypothetical protein AAGG38_02395 [Planctomycetota bacterium]
MVALTAVSARADTYALLVRGLSGDALLEKDWAQQHRHWVAALNEIGIDDANLRTVDGDARGSAGRAEVLETLAEWAQQLSQEDNLLLVLLGHGHSRDGAYKFQVRGRRLLGSELADAVDAIPARSITVVLPGPGGAALGRKIRGPGRVVISATNRDRQINHTRFGEYFAQVLAQDPQKPLLEQVARADQQVRAYYQDRNLARLETPTVWIEDQAPRSGPFESWLDRPATDPWTLAKLGRLADAAEALATPSDPPADAVSSISAEDSVSSSNAKASSRPPASPTAAPPREATLPLPVPAELVTDEESPYRVTVSTEEERQRLAQTPRAEDHPGEVGYILERDIHMDLKPDGSSLWTERGQLVLFDSLRGRGLVDGLFTTRCTTAGCAPVKLDRLVVIRPDGHTITYRVNRLAPRFVAGIVPGSRVEYAFQTTTFKTPYAKHYGAVLLGSGMAPIGRMSFTLRHDRLHPVTTKLQAVEAADYSETPSVYAAQQRWDFEDLPAVEVDPWVDDAVYHRPAVVISGFKDWDEVAGWYEQVIRHNQGDPQILKATAAALGQNAATDDEKIAAVFDYASALRYVSIPIGVGGMRAQPPSEVIANQFGDCKDKATLIVALLGEMGIESHFALVARGQPMDTEQPGFPFNHAVVVVPRENGEPLWLDATDSVAPLGMMPPGDPGRAAMLLTPDGPRFENIPAYDAESGGQHRTSTCELDLTLSEDGALHGTATFTLAGIKAYTWRQARMGGNDDVFARRFAGRCLAAWPDAVIQHVQVIDDDRGLSEPLRIEVTLSWDHVLGGAAAAAETDRVPLGLPGSWFAPDLKIDTMPRRSGQVVARGYPFYADHRVHVRLPEGWRFVGLRTLDEQAKSVKWDMGGTLGVDPKVRTSRTPPFDVVVMTTGLSDNTLMRRAGAGSDGTWRVAPAKASEAAALIRDWHRAARAPVWLQRP